MTDGAENRRKTILAVALGVVALGCVVYGYNALFGGSAPAPSATATPAVTTRPALGTSGSTAARGNAGAVAAPLAAPGVAARKMASTSSSLDPTLDETAMLRTESLVYTGTGRNIFSATYTPPVVIPKNVPPPRPQPVYVPPAPVGPPPPPPINLKFFGTETLPNGQRQAFLLQGEDVYLAAPGDIVARRYKIVSIQASGIQVEDLTNQNTQTLSLQVN